MIESTEANGRRHDFASPDSTARKDHRAIGEIKSRERNLDILFSRMHVYPRSFGYVFVRSVLFVRGLFRRFIHQHARVFRVHLMHALPTHSIRDTCTQLRALRFVRWEKLIPQESKGIAFRLYRKPLQRERTRFENIEPMWRYFITVAAPTRIFFFSPTERYL